MGETKPKKDSSTSSTNSTSDFERIGNWQGDSKLRKKLFEENSSDDSGSSEKKD